MTIRTPLLPSAIALLVAAPVGCGGAGQPQRRDSTGPHPEPIASASPRAPVSGYLNDGDNDPSADGDLDDRGGKHADNDRDEPQDNEPTQNNSYHDSDDSPVSSYGHAAGPADTKAVAATVERYYARESAGDGAGACALMAPAYARSVPVDYGQAPGPAYLRGAKTCPAVMTRLLARSHVSDPIHVTAVRLGGAHATAMVGSSDLPASYIGLVRRHGAWWIQSLLAVPLP